MERRNCSGIADGRQGTEGAFATLRRWPQRRCRGATEPLDDGA